MATTLAQYLEENRCDGFTSHPHYSASGDCVSYFVKDDRCFAERVDELVTVYHSMDTNELVGCKIKGVQRLLRTLGDFGVSVEEEEIELGLFFMAAAMANPPQKPRFTELGRAMRNARFPARGIQRQRQREFQPA